CDDQCHNSRREVKLNPPALAHSLASLAAAQRPKCSTCHATCLEILITGRDEDYFRTSPGLFASMSFLHSACSRYGSISCSRRKYWYVNPDASILNAASMCVSIFASSFTFA